MRHLSRIGSQLLYAASLAQLAIAVVSSGAAQASDENFWPRCGKLVQQGSAVTCDDIYNCFSWQSCYLPFPLILGQPCNCH